MHSIIIYERYSKYPGNVRYSHAWEFMFILSKGKPKTTHIIRDRVNLHPFGSCDCKVRNNDGTLSFSDSNGRERSKYGYRFDVWFYDPSANQSDRTALEHPASFPDTLAEDHILSWSNPNDVVLDPFCGSGTTCKMAYLNHRKYCGIDISQQYCDLAEKRVHLMSPEQYQRQNVKTMSQLTQNLGEY
jgi:site-specific DNA-methyltransferase (adenine-specific)